MKGNMKKGFLNWSQCLYMGRILCIECKAIDCDMKEGRELHRQAFENGYKYAIDHSPNNPPFKSDAA